MIDYGNKWQRIFRINWNFVLFDVYLQIKWQRIIQINKHLAKQNLTFLILFFSPQVNLLCKLNSEEGGLIEENFREIQKLYDRVVCRRKSLINVEFC